MEAPYTPTHEITDCMGLIVGEQFEAWRVRYAEYFGVLGPVSPRNTRRSFHDEL